MKRLHDTLRSLITVLTSLWLVITPAVIHAKTILVAPKNEMQRPGVIKRVQFTSINKALATAHGGDTILLSPGTYKEVIVLNDKIGMQDLPICIAGSSDSVAGYPIIDGGGMIPSADAANDWVRIKNSAWVEFARIEFRNGWTFPIRVDNSSYLSFLDCRFFGGKRVISVGGDSSHHILVDHCFWDQGGNYLWTVKNDSAGVDAWTSMHHGNMSYFNGSLIDFSGTGGSVVIRYNTIVNAFNGIRYRGKRGHDSNVEIYGNSVSYIRDNDFEPEYYTYNLHIYHNRSHNIHRTLSVDEVEGGNIYYYGNVVTTDNDPWSAAVCAGLWKIIANARKLSFPLYAFNNSFYGTGTAFSIRRGNASSVKHWNNAYYFTGAAGWSLDQWDSTNTFDYDISNKPWPASLIQNHQEEHGKIADVQYIDAVHRALRLAPGSPGVDAGKVVSLKEFEWVQGYAGEAPDVGAFENGESVQGPPFRFIPPPDGEIIYKEKPRIVRDEIVGEKLIVHFSGPLDPSTVVAEDITLFDGDTRLAITSVSMADRYEMIIAAPSISSKANLTLCVGKGIRGINGESLTAWASTLKVRIGMHERM